MIEKYAGAFPTWLAPVQVKVISISEKHADYAEKVTKALQAKDFRVETDYRNEKIGYKIRQAQLEKVPYMLVMGDKEIEEGKVSVRSREQGDIGTMTLDEFTDKISAELIH